MPDPPIGVEYVPPILALVNMAISLPLLLKKVPPNRLYGFRTRKTLSSPEIWYEANFKGAVNLIVASLVAMVLEVVISESVNRAIAPHLNIFVLIVAVSIAMIVSLVQIKNL